MGDTALKNSPNPNCLYEEILVDAQLSEIGMNPHQPRRHFSPEDLAELVISIREVGILHPPLVRIIKRGEDGKKYEIISGERRFRAAQLAGLTSIKVLVRKSSEKLSAQAALIENVQRVDLNPLEIAKALKSLMREFGFSQEEVAVRIGKKRSTVSNYLRLLSLPLHIQDSICAGVLTMGHAKAILSQEGVEKQNALYELILKDHLTVRDAEAMHNQKQKTTFVHRQADFFLDQLAAKLQRKIGTKVEMYAKGKKGGRIVIDYYSLDDLDRVLSFFNCGDDDP